MSSTAQHKPPRKAPLSSIVAQRIREGIASGRWPPGARLPAELEFAVLLGVSRSTLRDALALLEREGLVSRRQRAGTTVCARPTVQHPLQRNYSVAELIESSGARHGVRDTEIRFVAPSIEVAQALKLPPDSEVVVLERTRTANDEPVVRTIDWLDSRIVAGASAPLLPDVSFYQWLAEHCGIVVTHGVAEIAAMLPSAGLAARLNVEASAPVFALTQVDFTAHGDPVLYSEEYHKSDSFRVSVIRSGPFGR